MTWLASATLFLWLVLDWYRGMRCITQLTHAEPTLDAYPTLSVIIPALNEERDIERSLESVLAQDYPNLEIIILNDRSTDRTGEILERMKERVSRLEVIHIDTLPEGWLGKNHALYVGAKRARMGDGSSVQACCYRLHDEPISAPALRLVEFFIGNGNQLFMIFGGEVV